MSKSPITTDEEWLDNPHAGALLMTEFMEPLALDCATLAKSIGIDAVRLADVLADASRIDGELDLRLARYFRMSDGFFLRLQDQHEIRAARRVIADDLEQIVPRAA